MFSNKSIAKDAALILPAATLIRPLPAVEEKREAILAADPAIAEAARATIRNYRIVRFERSTP